MPECGDLAGKTLKRAIRAKRSVAVSPRYIRSYTSAEAEAAG